MLFLCIFNDFYSCTTVALGSSTRIVFAFSGTRMAKRGASDMGDAGDQEPAEKGSKAAEKAAEKAEKAAKKAAEKAEKAAKKEAEKAAKTAQKQAKELAAQRKKQAAATQRGVSRMPLARPRALVLPFLSEDRTRCVRFSDWKGGDFGPGATAGGFVRDARPLQGVEGFRDLRDFAVRSSKKRPLTLSGAELQEAIEEALEADAEEALEADAMEAHTEEDKAAGEDAATDFWNEVASEAIPVPPPPVAAFEPGQPSSSQGPAIKTRKCHKCHMNNPEGKGTCCKACNKVGVQIYRGIGSTPKEFKMMTDAERTAFYQDAHGKSQNEVCSMVQEILEKIREESDGQAGRFVPLSVWAAQGFDPAKIQANSTEKTKEWNATLGEWCYQVKIHETMENDIKRRTSRAEVGDFARRTMQRRSSSPRPPTEATGKGGVTGGSKEAEAGGKDVKGEDEGVATPKPKPKQKAKAGPSDAVLRKSAGLQVSVTTTAIISVTGDLADPLCQKVHPNIKAQAEEAKQELQAMQKAAEAALKSKDICAKGFTRSTKEVMANVRPHIDACSLLSTMLTALRQDARRKEAAN